MKIKIKNGPASIVKNGICIAAIAASFLWLLLNWGNIPEQIPGHYNAAGTVDRWGSKTELWFLPILILVLYVGITVLEQFPSVWNTGVEITEKNRARVYSILKNMIGAEKLIVCVTFSFLTINSSLAIALPVWFLPLFVVLMFGSLIYYIVKLNRAK